MKNFWPGPDVQMPRGLSKKEHNCLFGPNRWDARARALVTSHVKKKDACSEVKESCERNKSWYEGMSVPWDTDREATNCCKGFESLYCSSFCHLHRTYRRFYFIGPNRQCKMRTGTICGTGAQVHLLQTSPKPAFSPHLPGVPRAVSGKLGIGPIWI